jgi:hypothetical protein
LSRHENPHPLQLLTSSAVSDTVTKFFNRNELSIHGQKPETKGNLQALFARLRAEHVGSLLRPPEVLEARTALAEGRLKLEELRIVEDRAIHVALEKQQQVATNTANSASVNPKNMQ